jgi:hypothetical protein
MLQCYNSAQCCVKTKTSDSKITVYLLFSNIAKRFNVLKILTRLETEQPTPPLSKWVYDQCCKEQAHRDTDSDLND